ncbi:MAG: NAD-dependent epimerase/dehydratase family protein [Bacteroidia bacterium]
MSKVFVTGSDGLLGNSVVRELLLRKHEVVAMVLNGRTSDTLKGLKIELVHGDITDKEYLEKLSKGCDYFIHIAAITDVWPSRGAHYYKVNVEGTKNAIDAALKNKVKRFIHVGSASSFGYGTLDNPGDENTPFKSSKYKSDYIESKKAGQEAVLEAVKKRNLPAIVACPTFMIGPYDTKPSSGAMIIAIAKKKLPAVTKGGKNWVASKDVAVAICNALDKGSIGATYILGGENLSFKVAVKRIADALGQTDYPKFEMPDVFIKSLGRLNSIVATVTGKPPKLSYPMAAIACDGHYFNPAKAINELGLPQTPIEEAVKELKYWIDETGYL